MREAKPTVPGRSSEIDALRSFALAGILFVNIWYFADPYALGGAISPNHSSAADLLTRFTVAALFEAKFYLLFSFLFGYSFVLQERAAIAIGQSPVPRARRRLLGLLLLGLLHGVFLFFGDILLTYALMGLILLATRSLRTSSAVITGSALIGVIGSVVLAVGLGIAATVTGLGITTQLQMIGLAAAVVQACLTVYVDRDRFSVLAVGISTLTAPLLTAGYVSLLLLLFRTKPGARVCSFLAPAGRIALTNYLTQSLVLGLIFTGLGLQLADRLPAVAVAGIAVVIFAAQLVASRILLDHMRTGPAEWVLRRLTYGRQRQAAAGC
ncbi:DUF418 domain-containing protein [Arthrobacter sp. JZ12]|uniref:DUF418 domain-containing protein n=1 Tax=Arthrobacter sp. JZ12 TaxID=2654190 RepID=UPI002B47D630|nr:DUF418 domain-containing protein [Arthrobacter sp. JZ12]WRH26285.1 DUF418 domain-containing protein [Arthrobacter sp. JZ12]